MLLHTIVHNDAVGVLEALLLKCTGGGTSGGTLGRAKFSWCALTRKRLGATALIYGNLRPRATAQLHTVYAETLFMWEATHLHRETRRRSATSICY